MGLLDGSSQLTVSKLLCGSLGKDKNPVSKVPALLVFFQEVEGVLNIEETRIEGQSAGTVGAPESEMILGLYTRLNEIQQMVNGMKQESAHF